jgi:threonine/homoserine/homoserine lactone efflux protein
MCVFRLSRVLGFEPGRMLSVFGIHDLPLFIAAGLLLNLTPGPDTALVVSHSLRHGARGGVLAALGVGTGCFVHITAATVGLSALLLASATAFTALKWVGAAYLAFIGLRLLFGRRDAASAAAPVRTPKGHSIYLQGFLTNALNPKVALFFLAFLPQFVGADAPDKTLGFALLGLIVTATGTLWLTIVAAVAAHSAAWAAAGTRLRVWLERLLGAAFIALAAKLALTQRP